MCVRDCEVVLYTICIYTGICFVRTFTAERKSRLSYTFSCLEARTYTFYIMLQWMNIDFNIKTLKDALYDIMFIDFFLQTPFLLLCFELSLRTHILIEEQRPGTIIVLYTFVFIAHFLATRTSEN